MRSPRATMTVIGVAGGGWLAAALLAYLIGVFDSPPEAPPIAIGLAAFGPPAAAAIALGLSPRFREWARTLDLRVLTALQSWRIAGFAFLVLLSVNALPAGFALPAGLGDVAIGLTAPFIAVFALGGRRRVFLAWTVLGILDLVIAVSLGVLHSPSPLGLLATEVSTGPMRLLPMILVPTFGVPFTLTMHVLSLAARKESPRDSHRPVGAAAAGVDGGA